MSETKKRPVSDAQRAAARRYKSKMAEIKLTVSPDSKERYRAAAAAAGKSINQFFVDAVERIINETKR